MIVNYELDHQLDAYLAIQSDAAASNCRPKILKILRLVSLSLILLFSAYAKGADYQSLEGYSSSPLDIPVFDYAQVVVEAVSYNNWLNSNYSNIDPQHYPKYQEHLYYLITSYIYENYKNTGRILPEHPDLILGTFFSWAEKLGVYGAHHFYNKIRDESFQQMEEQMEIDEAFNLKALNDMYVVESSTGAWSLRFPYYFMIGELKTFTATNGMPTQLISISTGAAPDKSSFGKSQATLMLIFSPGSELDKFQQYWLELFNIDTSIKKQSVGVRDLEAFKSFDKTNLLHGEFTFYNTEKGSYLMAYLGVDGTFQTNRPHFLDFINASVTN